jgi:UDPglucose 6-dehydrogenase
MKWELALVVPRRHVLDWIPRGEERAHQGEDALSIIESLIDSGATISAYDPEAMPNVKGQIGDIITYSDNQYEALKNADALIIATEWSEFRTPDFERMDVALNENKIIFDGRNLFEIDKMREMRYYYVSIGREVVNQ